MAEVFAIMLLGEIPDVCLMGRGGGVATKTAVQALGPYRRSLRLPPSAHDSHEPWEMNNYERLKPLTYGSHTFWPPWQMPMHFEFVR